MSNNNGKISAREVETREADYISYMLDSLSFYRSFENATKNYRCEL